MPLTSTFQSRLSARWERDYLHICILCALIFLLSGVAAAQAGPPFRTDDPETPGNKQWEINFGWLGNHTSDGGSYSIPNFDINYGLGNRIQLKYELPIVLNEERTNTENPTENIAPKWRPPDLDLGESLVGVKWRFYEHLPAAVVSDSEEDETPDPIFSVSTYPQFSLRYSSTLTSREGAPDGPQVLLPMEVNARIGPLRVDGEVGYWFTGRNVPQSWIRGVVVGRELTRKTEAYIELYDQQDSNRVNCAPKKREATLGLGGRHALNREKTILLLLMAGRSFQKIAHGNAEPTWIAYVGVQLHLGRKHSAYQITKDFSDEISEP
jgi:hypothetical protein